MGIKNLNKFLKTKCPNIFIQTHLSHYAFKRVAIDISLYMHKFKAITGDRWLELILKLIATLRRNHIHCIFIFDGESPPEKNVEKMKRRQEKEKLKRNINNLNEAVEEYNKTGAVPEILIKLWNRRRSKRLLGGSNNINMEWVLEKVKQKNNQLINIQPKDFDDIKHLLGILNIPYYTAPGEAEKMCAKLCIDGKINAVLSEDTDIIAYGSPVFLTKIDMSNDTVIAIQNKSILENLELSQSQLLDLCIMCGTDYNTNIFRVGAHTAYKKLCKYNNIEGIEEKTSLDTSILKYKRSRELFTTFESYAIDNIPYCGSPDYDKLFSFMIDQKMWFNNQINKEYIHIVKNKLKMLKKDFTRTMIVFE